MDAETQALAQRVVEASQRVLALAEEGDWDRVADAARERDRLIHAFFGRERNDGGDDAQVVALLNRVFELNRQTERLVRQGRRAIQAELRKIREGRNAVAAYRQ